MNITFRSPAEALAVKRIAIVGAELAAGMFKTFSAADRKQIRRALRELERAAIQHCERSA